MTEHLKTCDTWHPDTESKLVTHKMRERTVVRCKECIRIRVSEHRVRGPYGVLPRLMWAPPQI